MRRRHLAASTHRRRERSTRTPARAHAIRAAICWHAVRPATARRATPCDPVWPAPRCPGTFRPHLPRCVGLTAVRADNQWSPPPSGKVPTPVGTRTPRARGHTTPLSSAIISTTRSHTRTPTAPLALAVTRAAALALTMPNHECATIPTFGRSDRTGTRYLARARSSTRRRHTSSNISVAHIITRARSDTRSASANGTRARSAIHIIKCSS